MTQAQVSYTDSCPLVLRYPVTGSLESVRLPSDVRERLIVECFTNNGVAGVKFREDKEEGWTPVSRRRSRRRKMGPAGESGIGCPLQQELGTIELSYWPSGSMKKIKS